MAKHKSNRCYCFSLYFSEDEKQWLKLLAEKENISMAEEIRKLIMDEKNRVVDEMNRRYRHEKK